MSVNKAILVGRLGRNPEMRQAGSSEVCSFSLVTTKTWVSNGERKSKTSWHQVSAWGKLGEICAKHLRKGSECFIEGSIEYHEWEKDGVKRNRTEIVAENVRFIGGAKQEENQGESHSDVWGDVNPWE